MSRPAGRQLTEGQAQRLERYADAARGVTSRRELAEMTDFAARGLMTLAPRALTDAGRQHVDYWEGIRRSAARLNEEQAKVRAVVATGKCPTCGEELRRNLSMSGWYQCAQLGAVGFRKDPEKPSCGWQGFTE